MRKREKSKIKEMLITERDQLQNMLQNTEIPAVDVSGDDADISSNITSQDITLKINERTTVRLKQINAALLRVEEEGFGVCGLCDEEIDVKRLLALPTVTVCVDCASVQEKHQRR